MKLLHVIFCKRHFPPRIENQLGCLRITGHLLLISCSKGAKIEVRQQNVHLAIRKLGPFDPSRSSDGFHGGDVAQGGQTVGSEASESLPSPLKLIDLSNQSQEVRRKYKILEWMQRHIHNYTR